ncbi:MAG: hypothetical protein H7061_11660, partial [Bdellovibrionaceae bacterium]|nr:hypothetical protein [Bdellovibrio sp.]
MNYIQVVLALEALQIMPKTMPGLEKIEKALIKTDWFGAIDPKKVIVVAGTNGKGSTCAVLEALLLSAGKRVGFYSSPHLVSTTERIRTNGSQISENDFIQIYEQCNSLIQQCELSHFEALTLMAGHYFFSEEWGQNLDHVILEVGLGGTFDATNAFAHTYSVITALALDHTTILGKTLTEVASNKFGIVQADNLVVHHHLPAELLTLKKSVQHNTSSEWIQAQKGEVIVETGNG